MKPFRLTIKKMFLGGHSAGISVRNLARLNRVTGELDSSWTPIPLDDQEGRVDLIKIDGDDLYVKGKFDSAIGGQPIDGLAKLNKNTGLADANWHPVTGWRYK